MIILFLCIGCTYSNQPEDYLSYQRDSCRFNGKLEYGELECSFYAEHETGKGMLVTFASPKILEGVALRLSGGEYSIICDEIQIPLKRHDLSDSSGILLLPHLFSLKTEDLSEAKVSEHSGMKLTVASFDMLGGNVEVTLTQDCIPCRMEGITVSGAFVLEISEFSYLQTET